MIPQAETLVMLEELHQDVRQVFEDHIPDGYAKEDSLLDLDSAFENAAYAVQESEA